MASKKVALLICSTRGLRTGPAIASWISSITTPLATSSVKLETLDLLDYAPTLPLSLPGRLPAQYPTPLADAPYENAQVNLWSKRIREYDGFIFLTPEYNWSFPGSLKVAIDHLFYEWVGKPAAVVSYGSRGGTNVQTSIRQVLTGVRMKVAEGRVELPLIKGLEDATRGVLMEEVVADWEGSGKRQEVVERWEELVKMIELEGVEKRRSEANRVKGHR